MEKQQKVINKIQHSLRHGNEGQLGTKKNDECYTSMQTILDELSYWANLKKFEGKRIICPCDWDVAEDIDIYGIEIDYNDDPAEVSAFKSVKSVKITKAVDFPGTMFETITESKEESVETKLVEYELREDEIEDFLRDKLTCNFVRTLTQNARRWGIKSITASGYNPATGKGIRFQDVDYSKYDICITNPPFSLYSDFMKAIVDHIDFIVLAPFLNRTSPCIGIPLMLKQAYLGRGVEVHAAFQNPTAENKFNVKHVNCDWVTSFSEAQEERNNRHFKTGIKYDLYKDEFIEMPNMIMKDDTKAIRVSMGSYPDDYDGWMFATVGVLDNLDQSVYEFYVTHCTGYLNKHYDFSPFKNKIKESVMLKDINGEGCFGGVVFRKKSKDVKE